MTITHKRRMIRAISKTLTLFPTSFRSSSSNPFCSSSSSSSSFAIKNVTKSNFESSLSDLRRHVRDADFVSIDLEMTGVTSAPWRESFEFDRFDIRYLKVKDSADKFAVVQFGICPFRWDSSKNSFIAHPHNFYVFPRQEIATDGSSYEFLCQTSSIDFLAKYQFDFNACINEGISYLSRAQENEAKLRLHSAQQDELLESLTEPKEINDVTPFRMADILFTERVKNKISEWHDGLLQIKNSRIPEASNDSIEQFQTIFYKFRPAIKLNGFTSRQLRLIKLVTEKNFKDLAFIRVNGASCSQQIIVYTESKRDRDLLMKQVKDDLLKESEMKIEAAIGFRHVIDLLLSERKLIVGHNSFLDMAHIYSKFLGSLPSTFEEYVSSMNKYFPYLIDTKILLNTNKMLQVKMRKSSTSLSKAFAILCPHIASGDSGSGLACKSSVAVEVQVDAKRSSNWNSKAKHQAGYDAFMTGCIFSQACNHLDIDFSSSKKLAEEEKLEKYINLLYLSWTSGDIVDMKSGTSITEFSDSCYFKIRYPKILFPNIALIWGFSSKLKAKHIKECVCKVFGLTSVTSIYHLDETAVVVQFSKPELVFEFLKLKSSLEKKKDAISVLHPLSELLEGGSTCAASYEVYKEICASPISRVFFSDQAEAVGVNLKTKLPEYKIQECSASAASQSLDDNETVEEAKLSLKGPSVCSSDFPGEEVVGSVSC